METHLKKIGMLMIAFLLFSYMGQAQMTITPGLTPACHDSSGAVTFTVSGGTGTTYYQLYDFANGGAYVYPPQTSPTFTHLWAGAYAIFVNNSTDSGYLYFNIPTVVNGQLSTTSATCSQPNGTATVTPIGGTAPYSYHWSYANDSTATITGLSPGFYAVTITDANGCVTGLDSLTARVGTISPDSASIHVTGAGCQQTLTVAEFGGSAPYTYSWNTGDSTQVLTAYSGLWNYVVTVTDANGCGATAYATVNVQGLVIDSSSTQITNASCGRSNGSIRIYMYNGTSSYTFAWSNGSTDSFNIHLAAGSYTVTVTDNNGCSATRSFTIYNTSSFTAYISAYSFPACGLSNGSIDASAYGGVPPYSYLWSNGATGADVTALAAGPYTVTVTDSTGCMASAGAILASGLEIDSSVGVVNPTCGGGGSNGSITPDVLNSSGPFTYQWSDSLAGNVSSLSGLSPGYYSVTVTGGSGCSGTQSYYLYNPSPVYISYISNTDPTSCTATNGGASVAVNGGTGTYTYLWSNGATGSTISGIGAGTYYVTATDGSGCSASASVYLNATLLIDSLAGVVNPSCGGGGNNGSITPVIPGGTAPFTYQWSDSLVGNVSSISGLAPGYYGLTVTDANGCSGTQWFYLSNPSQIYAYIANYSNPSTCGASDGFIDAAASGGTGSYTYLWSTGATGAVISGLPNGVYYVTVTDGSGCSGLATISLSGSLGIDSAAGVVNPTCGGGGNNGSITLSILGGTAPYTYQWSDSTAGNVNSISGLAPGYYYVTVTDATGCSGAQWFYLSNPSQVIVYISNYTNPSNCGASDGSVSVIAYGGAAPYTYLWSTGGAGTTVTNLPSGQYNVTVTDSSGCSAVAGIYLTSGLLIDSAGATSPGCGGSSYGSIVVTVPNGTAPFTYVWSDSTAGNVGSLTNLFPGQYSVTVTDATGCSGTQTYYIYAASSLYANVYDIINPACGASDGMLEVVPFNNFGTCTYLWSNGGTSDTIDNIPSGTYTVTVTDVNGCNTTATQTVTGQGTYTVTINTTPTACDTALYTGSATAVITGGTNPPYSFGWSFWNNSGYNVNPVTGNQQTVSNLPYDTYVTLIVTDASGCQPANDSVYAYIDIDSSCYDNITGYVFNDANGNCLFDSSESGLSYAYVVAQGSNGQTYYANPNSAGFYDIEVSPGIYTVTATLYGYGSCSSSPCVSQYTDTFTAIGQVSSGNNFAIGSGSDFDLGVHPGCYPSAPGSQKEYWVYYYNNGYSDANNAVVSFTHDPNLTLVSTNPPYSNYNASSHVISWFVGTVIAGSGWSQITMEFDVPSTLSLGTILYGQAEIDPISGDCDPSDNIASCSQPVTGSQDPNEKSVVPAGNLSASDSVLTYTIRFQNVGNAPANTIVVVDTLSPNVNPASVVPGASSAPYTFSMSGRGVMTFTFQAINLPDTSHGAASIGFVTYTVHTKPNLALGTTINNTAYVYFDANPAVVTNTTTNERSNNTGIRTVNGSNMSAEVIPNPAHDVASIEFSGATGTIAIQITDELGNVIATANVSNNAYTLNASGLASGIYFYSAHDANGNKASGKISVVH